MVLNSLNNKMKKHLVIFLFVYPIVLSSQYTETINSNRPGTSFGAFSVGKNVLQIETGHKWFQFNHKLPAAIPLDKSSGGLSSLIIRYGSVSENLEFLFGAEYLERTIDYSYSSSIGKYFDSFFSSFHAGVKLLVFDPFKNEKWHGVNFYSWRSSRKIKLTDFIPAVSVYIIGKNISSNIFNYSSFPTFVSNRKLYFGELNKFNSIIGISTQNHFMGKWVVVNNFSVENIESNIQNFNYIFTLTHNLKNPVWSIFFEYQHLFNEINSNNLYKFGLAYLASKNFQVDLNFGGEFKDFPNNSYLDIGASFRFDWHKDIVNFKSVSKEEINDLKKTEKEANKRFRKENKLKKKLNKKNKKKFLIF